MNILFRKYIQHDQLAVDQVVRDAWIELSSVTPDVKLAAPRGRH
jgi:hypothetical protein